VKPIADNAARRGEERPIERHRGRGEAHGAGHERRRDVTVPLGRPVDAPRRDHRKRGGERGKPAESRRR